MIEESNIASELTRLGVPFKENHRYFITSCPKHVDNHPSLKIYKDSKRCHCFSCGYNVRFDDYVKETFNIDIKTDSVDKNPIRKVFRKVIRVRLPNGFTNFKSIDKLEVDQEVAKQFNIGYCKYGFNKKKDSNCKDCFFNEVIGGFSYETKAGFCFMAYKRALFPVYSNGVIHTIESRDLSGKSDKKIIYPYMGRVSDIIYNYDNLDRNSTLFVTEGIKNSIKIWKEVNKNVTAVFSNRLKGKQSLLLKEFNDICVIPDNGAAGELLVTDLKKLGVNLLVAYLPKLLICKSCNKRFRGEEKVTSCPKCGGDKVSYCDSFDFSGDVLRRVIGKAEKKVIQDNDSIFDRIGVVSHNNFEVQRK